MLFFLSIEEAYIKSHFIRGVRSIKDTRLMSQYCIVISVMAMNDHGRPWSPTILMP